MEGGSSLLSKDLGPSPAWITWHLRTSPARFPLVTPLSPAHRSTLPSLSPCHLPPATCHSVDHGDAQKRDDGGIDIPAQSLLNEYCPGEHIHLGGRSKRTGQDTGARVGTQVHFLPRSRPYVATPQRFPRFLMPWSSQIPLTMVVAPEAYSFQALPPSRFLQPLLLGPAPSRAFQRPPLGDPTLPGSRPVPRACAPKSW